MLNFMPQPILVGLLIAVGAIGFVLWRSRQKDTNYIRLEEGDLLIAQAKIEAQAKLDRFVRLMSENPDDNFSVKVAFPNSEDSTEHIWVESLKPGSLEEEWSGVLCNKPVALKGKKIGSPVVFPQSDIEDWMVMKEDGSYEGGFSIPAVMRNQA